MPAITSDEKLRKYPSIVVIYVRLIFSYTSEGLDNINVKRLGYTLKGTFFVAKDLERQSFFFIYIILSLIGIIFFYIGNRLDKRVIGLIFFYFLTFIYFFSLLERISPFYHFNFRTYKMNSSYKKNQ